MVGSAIKEVFKEQELILTDKHDLDVRKYEDVMVYADKRPEIIIHLAAETDLERCEQNPDQAYMTNHTGTLNMMLLARRLEIPIIYISTAGVFNGEKATYNEYDIPAPINHYGRSKWFGEIALSGYKKVWIFRAGWMMGGGELCDKKFVNKVYAQITNGKKLLYGIKDVFGSPTYACDLAKTIKRVVEEEAEYGLYNCAGVGRASRYDVAKAIVKYLGKEDDIIVTPVQNGFFHKDFFCPRARSEVLENTKLNAMGLSCMRSWTDSLQEYIEKDFKR